MCYVEFVTQDSLVNALAKDNIAELDDTPVRVRIAPAAERKNPNPGRAPLGRALLRCGLSHAPLRVGSWKERYGMCERGASNRTRTVLVESSSSLVMWSVELLFALRRVFMSFRACCD